MKKTKHRSDRGEIESLKAQLARALADYDNFEKRAEREREGMERKARADFLIKILPSVDMLHKAQEYLKDSGLEMALLEFEKSLENMKIFGIKVKRGDKFDESMHEAIEAVEQSNLESGSILTSVLPGYKFEDGEIIRHAKVVVVKK